MQIWTWIYKVNVVFPELLVKLVPKVTAERKLESFAVVVAPPKITAPEDAACSKPAKAVTPPALPVIDFTPVPLKARKSVKLSLPLTVLTV